LIGVILFKPEKARADIKYTSVASGVRLSKDILKSDIRIESQLCFTPQKGIKCWFIQPFNESLKTDILAIPSAHNDRDEHWPRIVRHIRQHQTAVKLGIVSSCPSKISKPESYAGLPVQLLTGTDYNAYSIQQNVGAFGGFCRQFCKFRASFGSISSLSSLDYGIAKVCRLVSHA
jgi:hypothetical protein